MSTPPETPSPRSLAREAAGLLLVALGVLVVLAALGAVHPVLSSTVAAAGAFAAFHFLVPPTSRTFRTVAFATSTVTAATAVGSAFAYFPLLGWVEVGAGISTVGVWLASEGA
ncbi:hypothetical protein [Streptomyces sp. NRRL S-920]|uniref:hypothetical protein n=1 Tax=Streptomyces sp. NRRL S-920 TaxID=1463921 RepID=UPI00131EB385|nr:hypothetical protein [Streptomyces sp. NRRL S-920]